MLLVVGVILGLGILGFWCTVAVQYLRDYMLLRSLKASSQNHHDGKDEEERLTTAADGNSGAHNNNNNDNAWHSKTVKEHLQLPFSAKHISITTKDGQVLAAVVDGKGPQTVILVHGVGMDKRVWSFIFPELVKAGYHVIAYDLRGHGHSSKPNVITEESFATDLLHVLQHFDAVGCTIIGHSLGGFIALMFAAKYPEEAKRYVSGLCVISGFASLSNGDEMSMPPPPPMINNMFHKCIRLVHSTIAKIAQNKLILFVSLQRRMFGDRPSLNAVTALRWMMSQCDSNAFASTVLAAASTDVRPMLSAIPHDTPVLLIAGSSDWMVTRDSTKIVAMKLGDREVHWIQDAGHMIPWETPGQLLHHCINFLPPPSASASITITTTSSTTTTTTAAAAAAASPTLTLASFSNIDISEAMLEKHPKKREEEPHVEGNKPWCAKRSGYVAHVEQGVTYMYCTCGLSKEQPWCDFSHLGTSFRPLPWTAEKTGRVTICGCKATKNTPLCDGTHGIDIEDIVVGSERFE